MLIKDIPQPILDTIRAGSVIPAHPLALDENRKLNTKHQRALTRYYLDAGVGGIAVGVHSTQFEIRDPDVALFQPVLELASQTIDNWTTKTNRPPICKIAGVCGRTPQAIAEAQFALDTGYHAVLLSLAALAHADIDTLISHCREVANIIPIIGFYLQPAVGGRVLPFEFWKRFTEIDNVLAIKMAPFNRYQTLDVVRAVCLAGKQNDITLYTGNDDNIVIDLLTTFTFNTPQGRQSIDIKGGLLGHWAVWTKSAVDLLNRIKKIKKQNAPVDPKLLTLAAQITDANAAFFDTANHFKGCIPGIHEVLRRQGLLPGTWCLNPSETLSPNQADQITRIYNDYPDLNDDAFVAQHLTAWLTD